MTKAEEMKLFAELVAKLPGGYVRDILTEATPFIADAIKSDLCDHRPVSGIISEKVDAAKELAEVRRAQMVENEKLKQLRREMESVQRQFESVKSEIRLLAMSVK